MQSVITLNKNVILVYAAVLDLKYIATQHRDYSWAQIDACIVEGCVLRSVREELVSLERDSCVSRVFPKSFLTGLAGWPSVAK